jgi:hypothetical protein
MIISFKKESKILSCLSVYKVLVKPQLVLNTLIIGNEKGGELLWSVPIHSEQELLTNLNRMQLKYESPSTVPTQRLIQYK